MTDGTVSVWDFPRPPRLEPEPRTVRLVLAGEVIAETSDALRVLETSHPPTIYLPISAFGEGVLRDAAGSSFCEFKGMASYHDLVSGERVSGERVSGERVSGERVSGERVSERAGWSYAEPTPRFAALVGHVAVYPSKVDEAWLGDERVAPQEGDFYGGWITKELVGPFKGGPGTRGW